MERLERKGAFVLKLIGWILIFIPNSALCIAGFIISLQYHNDSCVTQTNYWNIFLDYWLLFGSFYQFSMIFMTLPCVCYHFKNENVFPRFLLLSNILMTGWISFGIFLVVKSDLKTCQHDSLWAMSIIFMVIIGLWITVQCVYAIIKSVKCSCIEPEPEYQDLWRKWTTHNPHNDRDDRDVSDDLITSVTLNEDELFLQHPM
jgi:hypothetical protein